MSGEARAAGAPAAERNGTVTYYDGTTAGIPGVYQGTDSSNFAANAPKVNIYIDTGKIATGNMTTTILYPGTNGQNPFASKTATVYDTGGNVSSYEPNVVCFDLDVARQMGLKGGAGLSSAQNDDNYFAGEIASFTYKDAATLDDGTTADLVVTYSNLHIALQTNINRSFPSGTNFALFRGNMLFASLDQGSIGNNQRYGIQTDIKVQVKQNNAVVPGSFYFSMSDIDVVRSGANSFEKLQGARNCNNYSEQIRLNGGYLTNAIDGEEMGVFIPGGTDDGRNNPSGYKCKIEVPANAPGSYLFRPQKSDNYSFELEGMGRIDGTVYTGFVAAADNSTGLQMTGWLAGGKGYTVRSYLMAGVDPDGEPLWHRIRASTTLGGRIETTRGGNLNGLLNDHSHVYSSNEFPLTGDGVTRAPYTLVYADGSYGCYTMTPEPGYHLKSVTVANHTLDYTQGGVDAVHEPLSEMNGSQIVVPWDTDGDGVIDYYTYTFEYVETDYAIHVEWEPDGYTVEVGKTVTGNMGDRSRNWQYLVYLQREAEIGNIPVNPYYPYTAYYTFAETNSFSPFYNGRVYNSETGRYEGVPVGTKSWVNYGNGWYGFQLSHGETARLDKIPMGVRAWVVEYPSDAPLPGSESFPGDVSGLSLTGETITIDGYTQTLETKEITHYSGPRNGTVEAYPVESGATSIAGNTADFIKTEWPLDYNEWSTRITELVCRADYTNELIAPVPTGVQDGTGAAWAVLGLAALLLAAGRRRRHD